ncbi:MAG: hypothetical protein FWC60_04140 [Firmicutes bacterium]|nr:hypothetical protein [Bacillota bacterium]
MATAGTELGKPAGPKPQHLPVSSSLAYLIHVTGQTLCLLVLIVTTARKTINRKRFLKRA